ncbi:MAG: DUF2303 family protein [Rickettsiales bacterium]
MTSNVIETFLQNGGAQPYKIENGGIPAVIIGSGQKIENIERFLDSPVRIEETRQFDDLRGFIEYIKLFKTANTVAFASRERIQVIFDYHQKDSPKWCAHTIEFRYKRSIRWQLWERHNNQWMKQDVFADFLDTGLNEIITPSQSEVLEIVKDFRATINAEVDSEIGNSGTDFCYRQTIKGGTKKTDISIPEYLQVQVAPFDGLHVLNPLIEDETKQIPTYSFRAKLSWRMQDSGAAVKPDFKLNLLNFDSAIDETLEAVRAATYELTGVVTYIGG